MIIFFNNVIMRSKSRSASWDINIVIGKSIVIWPYYYIRINIVSLQETKWLSEKSKELEGLVINIGLHVKIEEKIGSE